MKNKYSHLNFETIEKAVSADTKAIQKVVSHYGRYIGYFANDNYIFSEEIKATLMKAVLKFNIVELCRENREDQKFTACKKNWACNTAERATETAAPSMLYCFLFF